MFFIRGSLQLSLWFFKHSSLSSFFRYGSLGFSGGSLVGSLVPQARLSRFFRRGFYSFKEKKFKKNKKSILNTYIINQNFGNYYPLWNMYSFVIYVISLFCVIFYKNDDGMIKN